MRGIFFDEDDAREAQRLLRSEGFVADLERVRYAGEDDDADHPWAVRSDAPEFVLDLLVDRFDGWLDDEPDPTWAPPTSGPIAAPPPVELPNQPRRHHRPQRTTEPD